MKEEKSMTVVKDFNEMQTNSGVVKQIYTTIEDPKVRFNLDSNIDYKLNDFEGETIRVRDVMMKFFEKDKGDLLDKETKEPVVDENGEILRNIERKIVTIIIDEAGKSYVTASKSFALRMRNAIEQFGIEEIKNGLEIKIVKVKVKNSPNKALSFEVI